MNENKFLIAQENTQAPKNESLTKENATNFGKYNQKSEELVKKNELLAKENDNLKETNQKLEESVNSLKQENADLRRRNQELEKTVNTFRQENERLIKENDNLKETNQKLNELVASYTQTINSILKSGHLFLYFDTYKEKEWFCKLLNRLQNDLRQKTKYSNFKIEAREYEFVTNSSFSFKEVASLSFTLPEERKLANLTFLAVNLEKEINLWAQKTLEQKPKIATFPVIFYPVEPSKIFVGGINIYDFQKNCIGVFNAKEWITINPQSLIIIIPYQAKNEPVLSIFKKLLCGELQP